MLEYAGVELGIPSVISEIGFAGFSSDLEEAWIETNVNGMLGIMRHLNILPDEPNILDRYMMIEKTHRVNPSVDGYLHPEIPETGLLPEVKQGQLPGRAVSPCTAQELEPLKVPVDGWLYLIARPCPVNPGNWAFAVVDAPHAVWEA